MEDVETTVRVLTSLRSIGVRIAIDDFGTGYSSLACSTRFPVDTLKIDRAFVTDIATRPEPARLIRAILLLASDFGLHTVAEGWKNLISISFYRNWDAKQVRAFTSPGHSPPHKLFELLKGVAPISTGHVVAGLIV